MKRCLEKCNAGKERVRESHRGDMEYLSNHCPSIPLYYYLSSSLHYSLSLSLSFFLPPLYLLLLLFLFLSISLSFSSSLSPSLSLPLYLPLFFFLSISLSFSSSLSPYLSLFLLNFILFFIKYYLSLYFYHFQVFIFFPSIIFCLLLMTNNSVWRKSLDLHSYQIFTPFI